MGTTTNAQICFGIAFEEDSEFPWSGQTIEEWWVDEVLGYKPPFQLYDEAGNYLNGKAPAEGDIARYYTHRRDFTKASAPLPVREVNYCSGEYPMIILAVPDTVFTARRGDPLVINPANLCVAPAEQEALLAFCKEYGITVDREPAWLLSSYWG